MRLPRDLYGVVRAFQDVSLPCWTRVVEGGVVERRRGVVHGLIASVYYLSFLQYATCTILHSIPMIRACVQRDEDERTKSAKLRLLVASSSRRHSTMSYKNTNSSSVNLLDGEITADERQDEPMQQSRAAAPPTALGSIPTSGSGSGGNEQSIWQQSA